VGEAGVEAERGDGLDAQRPGVGELGAVDVARQDHHPLDPRRLHHLERRRVVARDRRELDLAADGDGLEAVLLTAQELLGQGRVLGAGVHRRHRRPQLVGAVDPPGRLAAHAGGRLEHQREADLGHERLGVGPRADDGVAGTRQPVLAQLVLHPRLVAEQIGGDRIGAGHAQRLADLGELDLQRLEDAEHPVQLAVAVAQGPGRVDELGGVETVVDPDDVVEQGRVLAGRRLLGDAEQADVGQARRRAGEAHRRLQGEGRREDDVAHDVRCNIAGDEGRVPRLWLSPGDAAVHARAGRGRGHGLRGRRQPGVEPAAVAQAAPVRLPAGAAAARRGRRGRAGPRLAARPRGRPGGGQLGGDGVDRGPAA